MCFTTSTQADALSRIPSSFEMSLRLRGCLAAFNLYMPSKVFITSHRYKPATHACTHTHTHTFLHCDARDITGHHGTSRDGTLVRVHICNSKVRNCLSFHPGPSARRGPAKSIERVSSNTGAVHGSCIMPSMPFASPCQLTLHIRLSCLRLRCRMLQAAWVTYTNPCRKGS